MRKTFYISILLVSFFSAVQAQKKIIYEDTSLLQKDAPVISTDEVVSDIDTVTYTAPVEAVKQEEEDTIADTALYKNNLHFPYDSVKNWRNLKEYGYTKYLDSLLKAMKKKPQDEPSTPPEPPGFLNTILASDILTLLLWALAICFVGFILYRLFLAEGGFRRRSRSLKEPVPGVEEEIITPESDFDAFIRQALQNGNYRHAIRYQYLRTLHLLAGKNLVTLAPDKTNYQYVTEITNRDQQQAFAALTLNYEYVWYGEFEIDNNIYSKIETNFTTLNQKI